MNKLCERCDTRCRLGICDGKEGDFKFCFRRVGSINGLEKTITPFNTLEELIEKSKVYKLKEYYCSFELWCDCDYCDPYQCILVAEDRASHKWRKCGFVTKLKQEPMLALKLDVDNE